MHSIHVGKYMYMCMYIYAAQRFGVCDVSDEFLVLLSHGLQVCECIGYMHV